MKFLNGIILTMVLALLGDCARAEVLVYKPVQVPRVEMEDQFQKKSKAGKLSRRCGCLAFWRQGKRGAQSSPWAGYS